MVTVTVTAQNVVLLKTPQILQINNTDITNDVTLFLEIWTGHSGSTDNLSSHIFEFTNYVDNKASINITDRFIAFTANLTLFEPFWYSINIADDLGSIEYDIEGVVLNGYSKSYDISTNGYLYDDLDGMVLGNITDGLVCLNDELMIGVYAGVLSNNSRIRSNFGDFDLSTFGPVNSEYADEQIIYVPLSTFGLTDGDIITFYIDSVAGYASPTMYTYTMVCCKEDVVLKYLDKNGVYSYLGFKDYDESVSVDKKEHKIQYDPLTRTNEQGGTQSYLVSDTRLLELYSGWVYESQTEMFEDLLLSDRVILILGAGATVIEFECIITDKKIQYINRLVKPQVGYKIKIKINGSTI